jgi:hypothetical protein
MVKAKLSCEQTISGSDLGLYMGLNRKFGRVVYASAGRCYSTEDSEKKSARAMVSKGSGLNLLKSMLKRQALFLHSPKVTRRAGRSILLLMVKEQSLVSHDSL